jgi:hypothetical protein
MHHQDGFTFHLCSLYVSRCQKPSIGKALDVRALFTCTFRNRCCADNLEQSIHLSTLFLAVSFAGQIIIGTAVQYSVDPVPAVQLFNSPSGVGPTIDTANPKVPPAQGACAKVTQVFAGGADNVQPSSVTGDLPSATGTQVCESRVLSGNVVFGNFPAAVLGRLSEGATAGSCEPGTLRVSL